MSTTATMGPQHRSLGHSRFSKALPAPPPLDIPSFGLPINPRSPLSPAPLSLSAKTSSTSWTTPYSQHPPRRVDPDLSKPLDSPLPPLPLAAPAKMGIRRKPIGLPKSPQPPTKLPQPQLPQIAPQEPFQLTFPQILEETSLPPLPSQNDMKARIDEKDGKRESTEAEMQSPTFSLSSLLSAYTATSANSPVRSDSEHGSKNVSTRNSDTSTSPNQDGGSARINATPQKRQFPPRKDSRSYKSSISSLAGLAAPTPTSSQKEKSLPAPPPPRRDSLGFKVPADAPTTTGILGISKVTDVQQGQVWRDQQWDQQHILQQQLPQAPQQLLQEQPDRQLVLHGQEQDQPTLQPATQTVDDKPEILVRQEEYQGRSPNEAAAGIVHTHPGPSLLSPNGASSSPPRPELWRRRSNRTDKTLALPELKLETTNGSTASPLQKSAPAPALQSRNPSGVSATALTRSSNALPGRNIRPVATRPAPAPPVPVQNRPPIESSDSNPEMGQMSSRIRRKSIGKDRSAVFVGHPNATSPNKPIHPNAPLAARPPTPEYQKNDVHSPILETVMSPVSPASSPEPPHYPIRSASLAGSKHFIRRRPVSSPISPISPSPISIRLDTSSPTIAEPQNSLSTSKTTSQPSESVDKVATPVTTASIRTLEIAEPQNSLPTSKTTPQPSEFIDKVAIPVTNAHIRTLEIAEPNQLHQPAPSSPSLTPHMAVVKAAIQSQPMPEATLSFNHPPVKNGKAQIPEEIQQPNTPTLAKQGPGSTVYTGIISASGTILDAKPLTIVHYQCFKQHRHFRQSPNTNCPLSCQTCHKRDAEMRWRCNWCALRVCRTCLDTLMASNRDLALLVENIEGIKKQITALDGEDEFGGSEEVDNAATETTVSPALVGSLQPQVSTF